MNEFVIDVLCAGHASYDLTFSVPHHPAADEKMVANRLQGCGGGPAANAAVTVARLDFRAAFAGYLGWDIYGQHHLDELKTEGVDDRYIVRGDTPTPVSAILVKPDGQRALINHKGDTRALAADAIDFSHASAKVLLFDGHEPHVALALLQHRWSQKPLSVLDAGSLHDGTRTLLDKVDYLVCSEKFALQYANAIDAALSSLAGLAPVVVITLGERGLVWQRGVETGRLDAPPIGAVDTTGAGDAFHGAFAAALTTGMSWQDTLAYASAAGAFCCTVIGARPGMPNAMDLQTLLSRWPRSCD
ncbi:MAG: carbohydrate kinase [Methylomonas sp.]|nr:carbohydrate kinase [Methylomonas sp.]PPD21449.1 MAG: carbohydrate kinase [Methylomonas sp.]PPD26046.1 MAG: carbohydrate kinase [Methylomonas sp.]PPD37766.1 MAG: carbohydrate kinase [Methylomonas sp.]PPD41426.1 MAG: carbohydrate kinase [Methylomonas sp.]